MSFTFVFGAYSAYILVKTHSLFASILLHSYCNCIGFPKIDQIFNEKRTEVKNKLLIVYSIGIISFFLVLFWV